MSSSSNSQTKPLTPAEEAFEREKAAITCYEEGWDRWDGPIWPVGTIQCRMQADMHSGPSMPSTPRSVKDIDFSTLRHSPH